MWQSSIKKPTKVCQKPKIRHNFSYFYSWKNNFRRHSFSKSSNDVVKHDFMMNFWHIFLFLGNKTKNVTKIWQKSCFWQFIFAKSFLASDGRLCSTKFCQNYRLLTHLCYSFAFECFTNMSPEIRKYVKNIQ